MSEKSSKYTAEFKQTIVNLYHSGKSYSHIHKEYGVSSSAFSDWVKQYLEVKIDDWIITAFIHTIYIKPKSVISLTF